MIMYKRTTETKSFLFFLSYEETEKLLTGCELSLEDYIKSVKGADTADRWQYEKVVEAHITKSPLVSLHVRGIESEGFVEVLMTNLEVAVSKDGTSTIAIKGERKKEEEICLNS